MIWGSVCENSAYNIQKRVSDPLNLEPLWTAINWIPRNELWSSVRVLGALNYQAISPVPVNISKPEGSILLLWRSASDADGLDFWML